MTYTYTRRISPETYLHHKEYFDSGLIASLEYSHSQNCKLKKDNISKTKDLRTYRLLVRNLSFKVKSLEIENHNLKVRVSRDNDDTETILEEIEKNYEEQITIRDEALQKSYEREDKAYDEIQRLRDELKKYKDKERRSKFKLDSTNSSLPPSSDMGARKPVSMREKSTKPVGGQQGHNGNFSKHSMTPDKIVECTVKRAPKAARPFYNDKQEILYYTTQEIDMIVKSVVTETRYYIMSAAETLCNDVMNRYAINSVSYSDDFKAMMLYLNHKGSIALDRLCTIIKELSQGSIDIKPGSICNWSREFYNKSETARKAILDTLIQEKVLHVDETGWRTNGKSSWMHTLCSKSHAYFVATQSRADKEEGPLKLLDSYSNTLVHDHFKSYYKLDCIHSECGAHIMRYLKRGWEEDEDVGCYKMMILLQKMIRYKNQCIEVGNTSCSEQIIERYRCQFLEIARETQAKYRMNNPHIKPKSKYEASYIKLMRRLEQYVEEHLQFLKDFRVPFTNNDAELQMRSVKTKKKVSGQSKSIQTANEYAAFQTIIQTSNLQGKNTLEALKDILNLKS